MTDIVELVGELTAVRGQRDALMKEIERLRGAYEQERQDCANLTEKVIPNLRADSRQQAEEIERLRVELDRAARVASLTAAASSVAGEALRKMDTANCEIERLRGTLMELRMRYHAAGRRPEECHEMSLIDEALGENHD